MTNDPLNIRDKNFGKEDFDCVKMKNDIQSKLYEKMKNLTFKEQREFIENVVSGKLIMN